LYTHKFRQILRRKAFNCVPKRQLCRCLRLSAAPMERFIFTLKADDFRVTDDGIEQKLTLDEDTDGEPLALVVAVETGGVGARRLASYGNLSALLGAVVGDVPHHVGWLDSTARRTLFRASNQART
jgi:hypothetical protein